MRQSPPSRSGRPAHPWSATQPGFAQSPLLRSDTIEMKRVGALATVQRLSLPARARFDPQVQTAAAGEKSCTFNIGDVNAAKTGDGLGAPVERRGLGRTEYITLVEATPICVQR